MGHGDRSDRGSGRDKSERDRSDRDRSDLDSERSDRDPASLDKAGRRRQCSSSTSEEDEVTLGVLEVGACSLRCVRLYEDKAELRRAIKHRLERGLNELLFIGFPLGVEAGTIILDARKSPGLTVHTMSLESAQLGQVKAALASRKLHKEAKALRKERAEKELRLSQIQEEKKALAARFTKAFAHSPGGRSMSAQGFTALAGALEKELSKLVAREMELKSQLKKMEAKLTKADEEANRRQGAGIALRVVVEATNEGDAEMELIYSVCGASWLPHYDLYVDTKARRMRLNYWASIQQVSGEKWADVRVVVASGRFADVCNVPKQCLVEVVKRMSPDEYSKPARAERSVAVVYELEGRRTILSQPQPQSLLITEMDLEPQLEYFAIPRESLSAFIRVRAVLRSAYALLPGQVSLYRDGYLVSRSLMGRMVLPKEEFVFPLGPERSLRIEYTFKEERSDYATTKKSLIVMESRTNVKNKGRERLKVALLEQMPKSPDPGAVKVSLLRPDLTAAAGRNPLPKINRFNYLEWQLDLGPDEDKNMDSKLVIEFPHGDDVIYR